MGSKVTTTAATSATDTGNLFQKWLQQQITGGQSLSGSAAGIQPNGNNAIGGTQQHYGAAPQGSNPAQSSSFNSAFQNMMNGQVVDPSGANRAIQNSIGGGPSNKFQDFQNPYSNQQLTNPNLTQLNSNQFAGQNGMVNLSGIGQVGPSTFDTQQGIGTQGASDFTSILKGLMGQGSGMINNFSKQGFGGSASIGAGVALDPATQFDMNNPYFKAIQDVGDRSLRNSVADERARWGANGAGSIGTGAQFAETNLQAAAAPQMTIALQQALQGLQGQDLAERGKRADVALGSRGQDASMAQANLQALIQGQGYSMQNNQNGSKMFGDMLDAAGLGRGQDFQNQQFNRNLDINQFDLGLKQSLANQNSGITQRGQDLSSLLEQNAQGNQFNLASNAANSQNLQLNNANQLDLSGQANNFNLANANQGANWMNQTNQLNSQNYANNQGDWLKMLGLGQNANNTANQNQQLLIAQLMEAFSGASRQGLPSTENIAKGGSGGAIAGAAMPVVGEIIKGILAGRK